jgi:hypothetical protein
MAGGSGELGAAAGQAPSAAAPAGATAARMQQPRAAPPSSFAPQAAAAAAGGGRAAAAPATGGAQAAAPTAAAAAGGAQALPANPFQTMTPAMIKMMGGPGGCWQATGWLLWVQALGSASSQQLTIVVAMRVHQGKPCSPPVGVLPELYICSLPAPAPPPAPSHHVSWGLAYPLPPAALTQEQLAELARTFKPPPMPPGLLEEMKKL